MLSTRPERRRRRSLDPHTALSLQLAHVQEQAKLSALVLASEDGLPIAHAGDADLCSELAAVAPFSSLQAGEPASTYIDHALVHVERVPWNGAPLFLAGCRGAPHADGGEITRWLAHAQAGVTRILAA